MTRFKQLKGAKYLVTKFIRGVSVNEDMEWTLDKEVMIFYTTRWVLNW